MVRRSKAERLEVRHKHQDRANPRGAGEPGGVCAWWVMENKEGAAACSRRCGSARGLDEGCRPESTEQPRPLGKKKKSLSLIPFFSISMALREGNENAFLLLYFYLHFSAIILMWYLSWSFLWMSRHNSLRRQALLQGWQHVRKPSALAPRPRDRPRGRELGCHSDVAGTECRFHTGFQNAGCHLS